MTTAAQNETAPVLACPECVSDNIHVVGYDSEGAVFDEHASAICGDCQHKASAHEFVKNPAFKPKWKCPMPHCGSTDLTVTINVEAKLIQAPDNFETEPEGDHTWDGDSLMTCSTCHHCDSSRHFDADECDESAPPAASVDQSGLHYAVVDTSTQKLLGRYKWAGECLKAKDQAVREGNPHAFMHNITHPKCPAWVKELCGRKA